MTNHDMVKRNALHAIYLLTLAIVIAAICIALLLPDHGNTQEPQRPPRDYPEIKQDGTLNAVTEYNALGYYADKDTIAGFQYELIQAFAGSKGLHANIRPAMDFEERIKGLNDRTFDIIACNLLATSELKDSIALTRPILLSKDILVQRKKSGNDSAFISNQLALAHKTVHIAKGSPTLLRLRNLSHEIGDTIYVNEIDKYGPEQLMALVAHGDIDYAVCDEKMARAFADSLPQLDLTTDISFTQFYAWGVRKQSTVLLDSLNAWLDSFLNTEAYSRLYRKYYLK